MGSMIMLRYKQTLGNLPALFWAFAFPIILCVLFHVSFGNLETGTFDPVKTGVVRTGKPSAAFEETVKRLDGDLLDVTYMKEDAAKRALKDGKITGVIYDQETPRLLVTGTGISQTILSSFLDQYIKSVGIYKDLARRDPSKAQRAARVLDEDADHIREVSMGGKTYDGYLDFYFALIAMACFFGVFFGQTMGEESAANASPLAARRCVCPRSRLLMALTDLLICFTIQFTCVIVLLLFMRYAMGIRLPENIPMLLLICALGCLVGVSFGLALGCSRLKQSGKNALAVTVPLVSCFFAGLMVGGMKYIVEQRAPIVNRINPAALISDAFYYLTVFDDPRGLGIRLVLLAIWAAALTACAVNMMRRDRYDSI